MKLKRLFIFLILFSFLNCFSLYAQESSVTELPSTENINKISNYSYLDLGFSSSFYPNFNYQSYVINNLSFYLDPYISGGIQIPIGNYFSFETFGTWNLLSFAKGISYYGNWIEKCSSWAGDATKTLNIITLGIPYIIGLIPAVFYSLCGIDIDAFFYYHPYYNSFFDTKIGLGISNKPSQLYDYYGYSYFILPMASLRLECDFLINKFKASIYTSYSFDILELFPSDLNIDSNKFHNFKIGLEIGLLWNNDK